MKGPALRRKMAVQRRWKCPACGRKVITDGDVTALPCACADPPRWMTMEDPPRNPRPVPRIPDATTLTDEDLDRLGIEALSEPVAESVPPETNPVASPTVEELTDDDAVIEPRLEAEEHPVVEEVPVADTAGPSEPPCENSPPVLPDEAVSSSQMDDVDDFGAGLDEPT
ncbi:MAG: hypothetical protein ACKVT0_22080 [Planctomycetaceae bacterium]